MTRYRFEADFSDAYDLLDDQSDIKYKTIIALESVLTHLFQSTRHDIHVKTRALLRSGKMDGNKINNSWVGTITYGGSTVDYAAIEKNHPPPPRVGIVNPAIGNPADHNYMKATEGPVAEALFLRAVLLQFEGD